MTVFLTLLALIGVLAWLLGIVNKSVSKKSSKTRQDRTEDIHEILKYGQFLDENEMMRLGNPNCPICHDNFTEFPKQSRTCKSCKAKLYVKEIDGEKTLIDKERNIEIRKMRDILREGFYRIDLPANDFLPATNLNKLVDKLWAYLNSQVRPNDYVKNLNIRRYQALILEEEKKTEQQIEHIIEAIFTDLQHYLDDKKISLLDKFNESVQVLHTLHKFEGFAKEKSNILDVLNELHRLLTSSDYPLWQKRNSSESFARVLESYGHPYKSLLIAARRYRLEEIKENIKSLGNRNSKIQILSGCCEACDNEIKKKSTYTLTELLKAKPLPHLNCERDFCSCDYVINFND
jgi:hypothetical protein